MPSNQNPLGALPARFRRERVLIVGCGDVGLRVAQSLGSGVGPRARLLAQDDLVTQILGFVREKR